MTLRPNQRLANASALDSWVSVQRGAGNCATHANNDNACVRACVHEVAEEFPPRGYLKVLYATHTRATVFQVGQDGPVVCVALLCDA